MKTSTVIVAVLLAIVASLSFTTAAPSQFCSVCQYAVQYVESLALKEEPAIEKALLGACQQLGDNQFGKICNTVVLVYGNEMLNALINYETPVQVCTDQLPLCPKNQTVAAVPVVVEAPKVETPKVGNAECEICKYAIGQIENFLNSNHSQQEIQKKLNQLCSSIPSIFTETCLSIARMVPYIIKKLEDHNSPSQICGGLHLCPAKAAFIAKQFAAAPVMTSEIKKLSICPACIMAMELVEQEISQQSVEKFVEGKLDKVCAKLPGTFGPACENLVDQYLPVLVQKLLLAVTPTKICKFVHACPAAEEKNVIKTLKANIVKLN